MSNEYRTFRADIKARALDEADSKRIVEGYATTFGIPYNMARGEGWEWDEVVDAGAFDGCEMADVAFQYNHEGRVMARTTNGTLTLTIDEHGLHVAADIGGTESGRSLYDEIKDGYVNKMSIGFRIGREEESEERTNGAAGGVRYITHIKSFERLIDVSAVSTPANDSTEIAARKSEYAKRAAQSAAKPQAERERKAAELSLLVASGKLLE